MTVSDGVKVNYRIQIFSTMNVYIKALGAPLLAVSLVPVIIGSALRYGTCAGGYYSDTDCTGSPSYPWSGLERDILIGDRNPRPSASGDT